MLSIFSCVCWLSLYLPWRNVCLGVSTIFLIELFGFFILSCMSYLYILEINPLSVALFANIFSQSERKAQEQGHIYMCVCVCIYICVCVCVCVYIYIYIC